MSYVPVLKHSDYPDHVLTYVQSVKTKFLLNADIVLSTMYPYVIAIGLDLQRRSKRRDNCLDCWERLTYPFSEKDNIIIIL